MAEARGASRFGDVAGGVSGAWLFGHPCGGRGHRLWTSGDADGVELDDHSDHRLLCQRPCATQLSARRARTARPLAVAFGHAYGMQTKDSRILRTLLARRCTLRTHSREAGLHGLDELLRRTCCLQRMN